MHPMTCRQALRSLASPRKVPRVGLHGVGYPFLIPRVSVQFLESEETPVGSHKLLEEHRGFQSESRPHSAGMTG